MTLYTHIENRGPFTIRFDALPESDPLDMTFDSDLWPLSEMAEEIENGHSVYFCARVRVSAHGIDLGEDYLGCCLYRDYSEFVTDDGYYPDMVETALTEARAALNTLQAI